jgi:hypothetical protein
MCATVSWGAHESFMHPIFVLKNGCDKTPIFGGSPLVSLVTCPMVVFHEVEVICFGYGLVLLIFWAPGFA